MRCLYCDKQLSMLTGYRCPRCERRRQAKLAKLSVDDLLAELEEEIPTEEVERT